MESGGEGRNRTTTRCTVRGLTRYTRTTRCTRRRIWTRYTTYTNIVIAFNKVVDDATNTTRSRRNQLRTEIFLVSN